MIYHFTLKGKTVSDPDIKERYVPLRPIPACVSAKNFDDCAKAAIHHWKLSIPEQLRGALKIHFDATIGTVQ